MAGGIYNPSTNCTEKQKPEIIIIPVRVALIFFMLFACNLIASFSISVPEEALEDGVLYSFQVSSVSTNNYEAYSSEFEILTPHYRVVQAITVTAVILLISLALAGILFYVKRQIFSNHSN